MHRPNVYVAQFGTGTNINLLPLAAGQIQASLKADAGVAAAYGLPDILFARPAAPQALAARLERPAVIGFSCFLWSFAVSLAAAGAVKARFPKALTVLGGPAVPKEAGLCEAFLEAHPAIDVVVLGEGEDVMRRLCLARAEGASFADIPGIVFRHPEAGAVRTAPETVPDLAALPSPYLDGSFDAIYAAAPDAFSGAILETNRGCPYRCAYCTWGNQPVKRIREKAMDVVAAEIDWIGRNGIGYIAMSDANFGIRRRDEEVAELLAACRRRYGVPGFVSVSWVKDSSARVLRIGRILDAAGIGYRVTLSLQSLNPQALTAVNRSNIDRGAFEEVKAAYRQAGMYSYTELILGLPGETRQSYLDGLEKSLSPSVRDQLYVYPCLLFPNTIIAAPAFREKHGIQGRSVPLRYTKSKEYLANEETVEIVVGTRTMPPDDWREAFVLGYALLGLHDDRLAFFILHHLRRAYAIPMVGLVGLARQMARGGALPVLEEKFGLLEDTARGVQERRASHLVEPRGFGGVPFDPPEGFFLELLLCKEAFFAELLQVAAAFCHRAGLPFDREEIEDLFAFQNAIMARPEPPAPRLRLRYNWPEHLAGAFQRQAAPLARLERELQVVDDAPANGDPALFLKNHFDVRGVPPFNRLVDRDGRQVFPWPVTPVASQQSLTSRAVTPAGNQEQPCPPPSSSPTRDS